MISSHLLRELFWRKIDVFDLHLEVLACGERILLGLDFVIGHNGREIIDDLAADESLDNLIDLVRTQAALLKIVLLALLAELRRVDQDDIFARARVVEEEDGHVRARVCKKRSTAC